MEEADNTDKGPLEGPSTRCTIHGHGVSEVEVLESWSNAIVHVVESVAPAVVSIASRLTFRDNGRSFEQQGSGSEAVIAPDGYILTNSHVVHDAKEVAVHFTDGSVRPAEIVGEDPPTDLAALKVLASGLPYLET